jgi:hypothetical protein
MSVHFKPAHIETTLEVLAAGRSAFDGLAAYEGRRVG